MYRYLFIYIFFLLENDLNITKIAEKANVNDKHLEAYGKYKAKINLEVFDELKDKKDGKLIFGKKIPISHTGSSSRIRVCIFSRRTCLP